MPLRPWFSTALILAASTMFLGCDASVPASKKGAGTSSATGGSGASSKSLKRLIILTNGDSPYWNACGAGVRDANTDLRLAELGYSATMELNNGTPQGQLDKLRQYGSQSDVAGIGVSAIDATNVAIADELRKLQKQGVVIITIDSDLDRKSARDARSAFIGTDNLEAGRELGKAAKALEPSGGEYVTFVGRSDAQNAVERIAGFGEGAGAGFTAKDSMTDGNDPSKARENVRNALGNFPNLKLLVGIWSYNAPAIVDVIREYKRRQQVSIVVFDAEEQTIQAMEDGDVDVMVVQDPYGMGYKGVQFMLALSEKKDADVKALFPHWGEPDGDLLDTGIKVVVPPKSKLKADLFSSNTQFMSLETFRDWLKKYNLSGS